MNQNDNVIPLNPPVSSDRLDHPYDLPAIVLCCLLIKDNDDYTLRDLRWVKSRREALEMRRELRRYKCELEKTQGDQTYCIRAISIMPDKTLRILYSDVEDAQPTPIECRLISEFMNSGGDLVCESIREKLELRRKSGE